MINFLKKSDGFKVFKLIIVGLVIGLTLQYSKKTSFSFPEQVQESEELLKDVGLSISSEVAETIAKELIPIIENMTEKKFNEPIEIKMVSRTQLEKVYLTDLIPQLKRVMPYHNEVNMIEMANLEARKMSNIIFGKYGLLDKILYLVPENISAFKKSNVVKNLNFESILKLIISHELTHVLQDQELDIAAKIRNLDSLEELAAFNATIEGHALFIQEQVGKHLKLNSTAINSSKIPSVSLLRDGDSINKLRDKVDQLSLRELYFQGKNFIEYYFKKGGNKMVWQVLLKPPVNTSMILSPASYSAEMTQRIDYEALLLGLEKFYGEKNWEIENIQIPVLQIRSIFLTLGKKGVNEIASKITSMQALKVHSNNVLYGTISIIKVKDKSYSAKIISLLEKTIIKYAERINRKPKYRAYNFSRVNFVGLPGDVSRKISYKIEPHNGRNLQVVVVYICRGDIIIEINGEINNLTDTKIVEIAEEIFKRYNQAKSQLRSQNHKKDLFTQKLKPTAFIDINAYSGDGIKK